MRRTWAYQGKKIWGNTVLLNIFCDVCLNYDFLELYGCEKKICLKFGVKTKKTNKHKKDLYLEFVSNFSIFVSKT